LEEIIYVESYYDERYNKAIVENWQFIYMGRKHMRKLFLTYLTDIEYN
jgi:hypothetical protein